jgi:putative endonuclease
MLSGGYLYILHSQKNDIFYVGSTNDIDRRIRQHKSGNSKYTSGILPIELVFSQVFSSLEEARKAEFWLKRQKSRSFLKRIIAEGKLSKSFEQ